MVRIPANGTKIVRNALKVRLDTMYFIEFDAGPSGIEPETAGFLPIDKSPVLYLAELRARLLLGSGSVQFNFIDRANRKSLMRILLSMRK